MSNRKQAPQPTFLVADGNLVLGGGYASGQITFPAAASITDTQTLTLSDGTNTAVVFEFEKTGGVTAGRTAIDISGATTATEVAAAVVLAINSVGAALNLTASNAAAVVTIVNTVASATGNVSNWASTNTTVNSAIVQPTGGTTTIHDDSTALLISSLQLGVVRADDHVTWVSPGDDIVDAPAIQVVQGTPNSSQIHLASPFNVGDQALILSSPIVANRVKSVSTRRFELGRFHIEHLRGFGSLAVATRYKMVSTVEGVRTDITHGYNREVLSAEVETAAVAPTNQLDFVLQNLALDLNRDYSKFVSANNPILASGNMPFVVFGIKTSGGSGTTIGTLTASSAAFNFAKYTAGGSTVQCTFKPTRLFINSLNKAIANQAGLATATIENLGNVTPGSAATIDELLVVTLHENTLPVFDDVVSVVSRAHTTFGPAVLGTTPPTYTYELVSEGFNGTNTGRQVVLEYNRRARQRIQSLQNYVHRNEYPLLPTDYLNVNQEGYTVTIIEHTSNSNVQLGLNADNYQQTIIVLPASVTSGSTGADASTGYTIATEDSATVTALNATLGAWLASNENVVFEEAATATTVFV